MTKLLVNSPTGLQEIIQIGEGGCYFDLTRVIWDERVDGALPPITPNSMKRIGNELVVDSTMLDVELVRVQEQKVEEEKARIKADIDKLEAEITPRRTREAILAIDTTWLTVQEAAIALLRTQL